MADDNADVQGKSNRHQCYECDWIYNEAIGWLEDGIAPATAFADIPTDWSCPDCAAEKSAFQFLDADGSKQGLAAAQVAGISAWDAPVIKVQAKAAEVDADGFNVWECLVCGWVYDEAKGSPEDGLAPGTRWADIPDDWLCPECGVGKEDFEMTLVATAAVDSPDSSQSTGLIEFDVDYSQAPLVVIGTGLAAYNLAKEWRKLNQKQPLIMVTQDDGAFYSKPLLSTGYSKNKRADQLVMKTAEQMAQELAADIRLYSSVDSVDCEQQTLTIAGSEQSYGQLVFATGASCIEAPLAGDALASVYKVNNLLDYQRFRTALVGKKKVLLIGAGLIGCEYANDLANGGFEIEAVEPMATVLGTLLPTEASLAVQQGLAKLGVKHNFGTVVKSVDYNTAGSGVVATLANGETIKADAVLSAIGVRANTQLAQTAGLSTNRGIVVDRELRASANNVFALGDCAEVDGHLLYFIEPLMQGARALAKTLNGTAQAVNYGAMPVAIKTPICPVVVSPAPRDVEGKWHVMGEGLNVKAVFKTEQGQTLGFALTGSAVELKAELTKQLPDLMA